jgi:hypothetical protein
MTVSPIRVCGRSAISSSPGRCFNPAEWRAYRKVNEIFARVFGNHRPHLLHASRSLFLRHLQSISFEKPRFYNEFAEWVSEALQEARLAEQLATIDLLSITSIRDLRDALIAPIEKHIRGTGAQRNCPEGDEFHFCEAKSFIMPTGLVAHDVADFFQKVAGVTNPCLHFHFFEARLRLGRPTNDFSRWLQAAGDSPASGTRSGSKLGLHQG